MPNLPRFFRLFATPHAVFREGAERHGGIVALCGLVAMELFMAHPATWVSSLLRLRAAPAAAVNALYTTYLHMALPPLVAAGVAGLGYHYAGRLRRDPERLDFGAAASAFAYAYLPHTLLVAFGVALAALGSDSPWLPQYSVAALELPWQRWCKLAVAYGPTAGFVLYAWRTLRQPEARSWLSTKASASAIGFVTAVGVLVTCFTVATHWSEFKPSGQGDPVPPFAVQGINRPDATNDLIAGHPAVIDFWATWCPPCIASLPHLQQLYREFEARGVVFVAVNIEPENRAGVEGFMATQKLELPVYIDADSKMQERFHVHTYPTTWVVDRTGHISKIYMGPFPPAELREKLEVLLAP